MEVGIKKTFCILLNEDEAKTLMTALQKSYGTHYYEKYLTDEEQDMINGILNHLNI